MKRFVSRLIVLILAVAMMFCICATAYAAQNRNDGVAVHSLSAKDPATKPVGVFALRLRLGAEMTHMTAFLLKNGFIQRTPRGRVVTEKAYSHLGISYQN